MIVADDHPLYRDGVVTALRSFEGVEICAEAADGVEALETIERLGPDVAVVDVGMPGLTGIELLAALTALSSKTRVVFISASVEGELVQTLLAAGACGYLSKQASRDEIFGAVRSAARGEVSLSNEASTELAMRLRLAGRPPAPLTAREVEILGLIAGGASVRDISGRLYLGTTTVKTHLSRIYEKLGVNERAAAVAEGLRRGLIR